MSANTLRKSGAYRIGPQADPEIFSPADERDLGRFLANAAPGSGPFRARGAGSAATDCASAVGGTVIDLTGLDRIRSIDLQKYTVTVEAGIRIRDLAAELASQGLELEGSHDLMDRTVGGAVASGCIGPSIGADGALFASQLEKVRLVLASGKPLSVGPDQGNLLAAMRMSYGMLGIIHEVTLRVRPVQPFTATHRRCSIDAFASAADRIAHSRVGLKFCLMPFRDRVYVDLRRHAADSSDSARMPWRLKDWSESTVLPHVFKSLRHVVPVAGVRYALIDRLSTLTQGIVNNRLVAHGSNSATQAARAHAHKLHYSTWLFPATDFGIIARAYRDFCLQLHADCGFRCDMPTMGFRLGRDQSALLSPSFDEPMFALRAISTQARGWEDFAIDFAQFAEHWGGVPFFNQSRSLSADHAQRVFGERLAFFRRIRRRLDPDNRLMNPFLSQYFL